MVDPRKTLKAFTEAAADAVGKEIARLRNEDRIRAAEHRALVAELESRIASVKVLERDVLALKASAEEVRPGGHLKAIK